MAGSKKPKETTRKVPSSRLHDIARRRVLERHQDELHAELEAVYAENGFTYRRRLTAEERAERDKAAELEKARAKIAALRDKYGDEVLAFDVPEQ